MRLRGIERPLEAVRPQLEQLKTLVEESARDPATWRNVTAKIKEMRDNRRKSTPS
jgi:hypothetical protein